MTMGTQQEGKDEETLQTQISEMEMLSSSGGYESIVNLDELPTRYVAMDEDKLWKYPGLRKNRARLDYQSHVIAPRTIVIKRESEEKVSVEFYGHNSEGEKASTKLVLKDESGCDNVKIIIGDYVVSSCGEITKLSSEKLPDTSEEEDVRAGAELGEEANGLDLDSDGNMVEDPTGIDSVKKAPCVAVQERSLTEGPIKVEQITILVETEIGDKDNESGVQAPEAERSCPDISVVEENVSDSDMWRWWRFNGPELSVTKQGDVGADSGPAPRTKPEVVDVNEILKDWYRWYW